MRGITQQPNKPLKYTIFHLFLNPSFFQLHYIYYNIFRMKTSINQSVNQSTNTSKNIKSSNNSSLINIMKVPSIRRFFALIFFVIIVLGLYLTIIYLFMSFNNNALFEDYFNPNTFMYYFIFIGWWVGIISNPFIINNEEIKILNEIINENNNLN